MKLKGTKTEDEMQAELRRSHEALVSDPAKSRLREALRSRGINENAAFVLNWIPEQSEDLYEVLIDQNTVLEIELERLDSSVEPVISELKMRDYERRLSKNGRIKLAVAISML